MKNLSDKRTESCGEIKGFFLVPTLRLPFFILTSAILFVAGFWRHNMGLYAVAFFLAVMIVSALVYAVVMYASISVGFYFKNSSVKKGCTNTVILHVRNKSLLPVYSMKANIFLPKTSDKKEVIGRELDGAWVGITCGALSEEKIELDLMFPYAGGYDAQIGNISAYDPLKLFRCVRLKKSRIQTAVLPGGGDGGIFEKIVFDNGEQNIVVPLGGDSDEFFDIRAYLPGDALNDIHWKLAAKSEELPVIRHSATDKKQYLVICDAGMYYGDDMTELADCDEVLCQTAELLGRSSEKGMKLVWDGGARDVFGEADARDAITELLFSERHEAGRFSAKADGVVSECSGMTLLTARFSEDILQFVCDFRYNFGTNISINIVLCGDHNCELPEKQLTALKVCVIRHGGESS